jgi:hypothetical protein
LLKEIKKQDQAGVIYRAAIPNDLKAIEENPVAPIVIIGTADGGAAIAR